MEIRGAVSRHEARVCALQVLYAVEVGGHNPSRAFDELVADSGERYRDFARRLVMLSHRKRSKMDDLIQERSQHWDLERIALLDRLILRIALCELFHIEDVPPKVTINEAIEVAKVFSTEQSGRFINGILDAIYSNHEAEIRRAKKGNTVSTRSENPAHNHPDGKRKKKAALRNRENPSKKTGSKE